jgi:hypothetical protein
MNGSTMKLAFLSASVLLALAGHASAQTGMTPPEMTPTLDAEQPSAPAPAPVPADKRLSEGTALALSLGGTALSWAALIGAAMVDNSQASSTMGTAGAIGIVFAPTFGHWYADTFLTRGLGLRLGGVLVALAGVVVAFTEDPPCFGFGGEGSCPEGHEPVVGTAIAFLGVGMVVAGTVDDIITAPRRVQRLNQAHDVAIAPIVTQHSAGLALGGRF